MPPCRMAVHTERPLGPPPPREGRERERKRRKRGRSWSKQAAPTWTRCLTLDSAFPKIPDNRLANPFSSWHFSFGGFLGRRRPRGQPLVFLGPVVAPPFPQAVPLRAPPSEDRPRDCLAFIALSISTHPPAIICRPDPTPQDLSFQVVLRESCDRVEQERRVNSPATTISTLARYSDQARPSNPSS